MNSKKKQQIILAHIGLIIAILIWGSTYFVIKDSLKGVHPVSLVFYRFLIATSIMGGLVLLTGKKPVEKIHHGMHLGLLLWLLYIPQTIGLLYVSASNSGFITSLYIILIPIISALFLKAKITRQRALSVGIALIGLYLVTGGIENIGLGDSITLISAVAIAFEYLLIDHYLKLKADPLVLCFQQFLFLTICTAITMILVKAPFSISAIDSWYHILYLAIFPSVLSYFLQTKSQIYITPMTVSIFGVLEPISGAFFAWTLGGERMMPMEAFGGMLIVIAILVAEIQIGKKKRSKFV